MSAKNKKLVSIIIPAYNMAGYIGETLKSIIAQTYQNWEGIIIDDGSTDNTREAIEPFLKDGRFRYIYQSNKGLAGARNTGFRIARGDFIALLDSDDLAEPEKISHQVMILENNPDYGVCYSGERHFYDSQPEKKFFLKYSYHSGAILKELLFGNFIAPSTVMVRKSVLEKIGYFDENLKRSEDWAYWIKLAYHDIKFYYLEEPLTLLRIRLSGNLGNQEHQVLMKSDMVKALDNLKKEMTSEEVKKYKIDYFLSRLHWQLAAAQLIIDNKQASKKECRSSLKIKFNFKAAILLAASYLLPVQILKKAITFMIKTRASLRIRSD